MERKLASVRKVDSLTPIEEADKIELATVGGWQVVVQKGQHNVGDLAIFFEIDSFVPNWPEFQFLGKPTTFNGEEGYRLRTIRLRKKLSQGLLLPLSDFAIFDDVKFEEGFDLTENLSVKKWEKPLPASLSGMVRGNFPSFIPKTDEERVQNIPLSELNKYKDDWFYETVKLDGSSMTVYIASDVEPGYPVAQTGVCSRNLDLKQTDGNSFWEAEKKYGITERLQIFYIKHSRSIAIQGELYGEGIQNNPWKISGRHFAIYNIWSIDDQKYLTPTQMIDIIEELNLYPVEAEKLKIVPINRAGILGEMFAEFNHKSILENVDSFYDANPSKPLEGFVYKNDSAYIDKFSFKVISNKYLEKLGE